LFDYAIVTLYADAAFDYFTLMFAAAMLFCLPLLPPCLCDIFHAIIAIDTLPMPPCCHYFAMPILLLVCCCYAADADIVTLPLLLPDIAAFRAMLTLPFRCLLFFFHCRRR